MPVLFFDELPDHGQIGDPAISVYRHERYLGYLLSKVGGVYWSLQFDGIETGTENDIAAAKARITQAFLDRLGTYIDAPDMIEDSHVPSTCTDEARASGIIGRALDHKTADEVRTYMNLPMTKRLRARLPEGESERVRREVSAYYSELLVKEREEAMKEELADG